MNHTRRTLPILTIPFVLTFILIGCRPSREQQTPVVSATDAKEPTPTDALAPAVPAAPPEPLITPTPTHEESLIRAYQILFVIRDNAQQLSDLADQVNMGIVEDTEAPALIAATENSIQGVESLLAATAPVEALQPVWEDAIAAHQKTRTVAHRWKFAEIAAPGVLSELTPVMENMDAVLEIADEILVEQIAISPEALASYRAAALSIVAPQEPPEAAALGESSFTLVDDNWFEGQDGSLHVIGLVESTEEAPVQDVDAIVTLLDGEGNTVISQTLPVLTVLLPQRPAPFEVLFLEEMPAWESYLITFRGKERDSIAVYTGFEILEHSSEVDAFGELSVEGQIKNVGDRTARNIRISVVLYDAEGKVVGVGSGVPELWQRDANSMLPGDVDTFGCVVQEWAGTFESVEFFAEADPSF